VAGAAERLPAPGELEAIFRPFLVEQVVLAPDGRHLAYAMRDGGRLSLVIEEVDRPANRRVLRLGEDATTGIFRRRVNIPATLSFLRWTEPTRLVYAVSVPNPNRNEMREEVRVFTLPDQTERKLVDSYDLAYITFEGQQVPRRPRVVGLHPESPDTLFVEATPLNTQLPELYKVSVATGKAESQFTTEELGRYLYDATGRARIFETPYTTARMMVTGTDALLDAERQGTPEDMAPRSFALPEGVVSALQAAGISVDQPPEPPPEPEPGQVDMSLNLPGRPSFDYGPKLPPAPDYWTQVFRYRASDSGLGIVKFFGADWQELDRVLGLRQAPEFRVSIKNFYGQRSFPVAFDANPDILYVASNVGRQTYGLYAVDLKTRQRTGFAVEDPHLDLADPDGALSDSALLFDRRRRLAGVRLAGPVGGTKWLNPTLARFQESLQRAFPGRYVDILDWDDAERRVLALVFGPADPGRYYVIDDTTPLRITEFFKRAPDLTANSLHRTLPFEFDTADGTHLTGTLTLPRRTRISPAPLVLLCRDLPGKREWPSFNREVQALAAMGFAVATVNYRGLSGFGTQHRDKARDAFDRVPIEDLRAAAAWIIRRHPVHAKRVALFGEGFGGYLALRATQLYPDDFRCAVSINAPTDPAAWITHPPKLGVRTLANLEFEVRKTFFERSKLGGLDLADHVTADGRPALIIQDAEKRDLQGSQGTALRNAMKRRGIAVEYVETSSDFTLGYPEARARAFNQISEFLNDHIYDYRVDLGKEKEVK
jgi:dienelactone hydrolase